MFSKDELNQLYRYALSLSGLEDTAYDLVQSGIEKYLKKTSSSTLRIENPLAYLKTTIRNLYFDWLRHQKIVPMVSIDNDEFNDEFHINLVDSGELQDVLINQQEVEQLINGLSPQENELLYLWAVEEHTAEEISKIYAKPRGTILSKLHRLKKRIRAQFGTTILSAGAVKSDKL